MHHLYSCVKRKNQLDATYFIIYSILIDCSTKFHENPFIGKLSSGRVGGGQTDVTILVDTFRNCVKKSRNQSDTFHMEQNNVIKEAILMVIIMDILVFDRFSYALYFYR